MTIRILRDTLSSWSTPTQQAAGIGEADHASRKRPEQEHGASCTIISISGVRADAAFLAGAIALISSLVCIAETGLAFTAGDGRSGQLGLGPTCLRVQEPELLADVAASWQVRNSEASHFSNCCSLIVRINPGLGKLLQWLTCHKHQQNVSSLLQHPVAAYNPRPISCGS